MNPRIHEYAKGDLLSLRNRFPDARGVVRMLGLPKDRKKVMRGPVPGGKFWAVHNRNDLPNYENGIYMPWGEFFEIHDMAWWQSVGHDGSPKSPWTQFTSENDLPDIKVNKSTQSIRNHLGEYEDYEAVDYDPLVQIYATYRQGDMNPYKKLRMKGKMGFKEWIFFRESRNPLNYDLKFYHGSSDAVVNMKGFKLLPPNLTNVISEKGRKKNLNKVFFTTDIGYAKIYAGRTVQRFGGSPIVFRVIPMGSIEKIHEKDGHSVYYSDWAFIDNESKQNA